MRRLLSDETGSVTMEFTLLVPTFVALLVFLADATIVYLTHSEMYNAARDISRSVSTGQLKDHSEVEAYAAKRLFLSGRNYVIDVDFSDDKKVIIAVQLDDAAIFGRLLEPVVGDDLVARSTTGEEPRIK